MSPARWPRLGEAAFLLGIGALVSGGCRCAPSSAAADVGPVPPVPVSAAGRTSADLTAARVVAPTGTAFDVEVVQDPASRERGLQERARLGEGEGMLFVFPTSGPHRFWMHRCLIALDIVWIDDARRVVHLAERLPPCRALPCPDYGPSKDARYVLEVGEGVARRAGLVPGARVSILFARSPNPT